MTAVFGPYRAEHFVDRIDLRAQMQRTQADSRVRGRACLMFLHGPDGIGRTSLVSEFFHENSSAFDGYIEVAARQPDGRMVQQGELLGQALQGLGMAESELPTSDVDRAAAFQRVSAGKAFLMVIKEVASADQVRALIPGSAPRATVVATTHSMLRDLLLEDFVDVALTKLPADATRELLVKSMRGAAAQVPFAVIDELAELCDGFPLLVRILGAQLVGRPHLADQHLQDLRASESALLTMDDAQRVATFLNLAYNAMDPDLRRPYRHLSLLSGPTFSAEAAAVALETDVRGTGRVLERLLETNLLQRDGHTGRYSFYRVVRADAGLRALQEDGPESVRSSTERITTWYLREAIPRDAALANRWRIGREFDGYAAVSAQRVPRADAIKWFEAEWTSVVACVRTAHDQGVHEVAWQLCIAAYKFLHLHGHVGPWLDSHELGLASATACGDQLGIMQVTHQRGAAYHALGKTAAARADFNASLQAATLAGHRLGEQSAWEWLGKTFVASGDFSAAFRCFDRSEAVIDGSDGAIPVDQQARMRALLGLQRARARLKSGDRDRAAAEAAPALDYFRSTNELENQAKSLMVMGDAAVGEGEHAEAAPCYDQAASLFADDGVRRPQAEALLKLGDARRAAGDRAGANDAFHLSRDLYVQLGEETADIDARITGLNGQ